MAKLGYKVIAKERIKDFSNIVISETQNLETGEFLGYSVTEQAVAEDAEGKEILTMFKKNGLGILDKEGLKQLGSAINKAVEQI